MYMKKLFTMLAVCLCGTMAYAQTSAISSDGVTIAKGGTAQMEVVINNATSNTAFQFDLKLPAKVSVKNAGMKGSYGENRILKYQQVDASNNIYRFLSYDNENATLASDGNGVIITMEAEADAESGQASLNGEDKNLVVNPAGESTSQAAGDLASVTVADGVNITVPAGKKLMMVSDKALDFTSMEFQGVKAYICTGYELVGETNRFWLTRVNDVPANTPIMVKAEVAGDYTVPEAESNICYPKSFLSGDANNVTTVDYSADFKYFGVSLSTGKIGAMSAAKQPTVAAGKSFFQVPATIVSNVANGKQEFTLGKGGRLATVSDYDLDFSDLEAEGVKAYAVTGFDKNRKVWMTRVMNVNAGTPFVLRGSSEQTCQVSSIAGKAAYVNMLDANRGAEPVTVTPTIDDCTVYVLSLGKGSWGTLGSNWSAAKGKAWMLVPTEFHNSLPASTRGDVQDITEYEAEVICLESISGDGDATGISRVAAETGVDTWYNLSGQRISAPTKKGLYIKNGKKVILK
jgi:hypothetical protein